MSEDKSVSAVYQVAAGSDPKALGSFIALSLKEGKEVRLRSIGASAVNQAVKAVAIASQWTAPRGVTLAIRPGFAEVVNEHGDRIVAIVLTVIEV